jgi:hypothetical protein
MNIHGWFSSQLSAVWPVRQRLPERGKINEIRARYAALVRVPQQGRTAGYYAGQDARRGAGPRAGDRIEGLMATIARIGGIRLVRLIILGLSLTLAACDKCIVPTWNPSRTPTPASCHDDSSVK